MIRLWAVALMLAVAGMSVLALPSDPVARRLAAPVYETDPQDGPVCIAHCPERSHPVCFERDNGLCPGWGRFLSDPIVGGFPRWAPR